MRVLVLAAALAAVCGTAGAADQFKSQYTDVDTSRCKSTGETEDGFSVLCKGLNGIAVTIAEGDLREYVSYGPDAKNEKAASQTLPPFNRLGQKMEWRFKLIGGRWAPVATILRWYTAAPDEAEDKTEGQVLVVTQLGTGAVCHIAYVDARAASNPNQMARDIADKRAGNFDCADEPDIIQPFTAYDIE
jgi:hypothetical protein